MAEIINLRTARKRRARSDKADEAANNRIKFGRTKGEKALTKAEKDLADRKIDGHKRED